MKAWHFVTNAPYRNAFVLTATYPDDWSDDAGRAVPHPWGTLTGGRYVFQQIGGGEGGTVDAWQFVPPVFTESAAMPANLRGLIKRFIPINAPQDPADWSGWTNQPVRSDTDPLHGSRPGMVADIDVSKLPDKGKYFIGFYPIDSDAARANLLYPDLLRNDPNYGTITFWANLKDPDANEAWYSKMAPMVIVGLVGAGFMAVGFPALALDSIKAAQSGNPSSALLDFAGQIPLDTFDIGDVLSDTDVGNIDFTSPDPGFLGGAVDPFANADTSLPSLDTGSPVSSGGFDPNSDFADTTLPPDSGTMDDTSIYGTDGGSGNEKDLGSNEVQPDNEPGMPRAPSIPSQAGINSKTQTRPGSSGIPSSATPGSSLGGILASIFGTNPNHAAPGYPAGGSSLYNPKPITGSRYGPTGAPQSPSAGSTPGGLLTGANIFASPVLIGALVIGALAFAMTK